MTSTFKSCRNMHVTEHACFHAALEASQPAEDNDWTEKPDGWAKVENVEVHTDGKYFLIAGYPHESGDDEKDFALHDCDQQGCGQMHVLHRGEATWLPQEE